MVDFKILMTPEQYFNNEDILTKLSVYMGMNIRVEDINTGELIMLMGGRL